MLRARALQIVDEEGRVRASLAVVPAVNGEKSEETVLLRLITERGRPSVKIGASEKDAGLALAGPTGTRNTWVTLRAEGTKSSLTSRMKTVGNRLSNRSPTPMSQQASTIVATCQLLRSKKTRVKAHQSGLCPQLRTIQDLACLSGMNP